MATSRTEEFVFSIESAAIYDYDTGEPYCVRQFAGQSATLNVTVDLALLPGADVLSAKRIEQFGGQTSFDLTVQEAPIELINIANVGTLSTDAACASATISPSAGVPTDKSGTLSAFVTSIAVSAGSHSSVVHDTIYIEALSTSTLNFQSYSTGKSTGAKTASGTTRLVDSTVMPGITMDLASGFIAGATAVFQTEKVHAGKNVSSFGLEHSCSSTTYVGIKGIAKNCSDGNVYEFELYKCLITGASSPLTHGDYMVLSLHGDGQTDDSLSTPAAGTITLVEGTS